MVVSALMDTIEFKDYVPDAHMAKFGILKLINVIVLQVNSWYIRMFVNKSVELMNEDLGMIVYVNMVSKESMANVGSVHYIVLIIL